MYVEDQMSTPKLAPRKKRDNTIHEKNPQINFQDSYMVFNTNLTIIRSLVIENYIKAHC